MPPSAKHRRVQATDLATAKRSALRAMELWRRSIEEHDRLAKAAAHGTPSARPAARRRLDALYTIIGGGRPSPAALEFWLTRREAADVRDFRIWLLHHHVQALVAAAREEPEWSSLHSLSARSTRFALAALGARKPAAQRAKELELERAIRAVLGEEHAEQPGKWWDAVRVIAHLKRFKSESTITRAVRDHRRRQRQANASASVSPIAP